MGASLNARCGAPSSKTIQPVFVSEEPSKNRLPCAINMLSSAKDVIIKSTGKLAATAEDKLSVWEQQEASSSKKKLYGLARKGATLVKSRVATRCETDTTSTRDTQQEVRLLKNGILPDIFPSPAFTSDPGGSGLTEWPETPELTSVPQYCAVTSTQPRRAHKWITGKSDWIDSTKR
jgi:uncharacterized membrane protein